MQGDRTDKKDTSAFNSWKDIIIPGNIEDGMTMNEPPIVQPLPLSKRKYLANYLGRAQGKIGRLKLIELGKQFPDKVYIFVLLLICLISLVGVGMRMAACLHAAPFGCLPSPPNLPPSFFSLFRY